MFHPSGGVLYPENQPMKRQVNNEKYFVFSANKLKLTFASIGLSIKFFINIPFLALKSGVSTKIELPKLNLLC